MSDEGSCDNMVAKSTLGKMKLKTKPHLQLYNVIWVDKDAHLVTFRC